MCWNWLRSISPSRERGVGLRVLGEVDDVDRDALIGCGLLVDLPVGVARADDTDLHGVVFRALLGVTSGSGAAGEDGDQGKSGCCGQDLLGEGHGCFLSVEQVLS